MNNTPLWHYHIWPFNQQSLRDCNSLTLCTGNGVAALVKSMMDEVVDHSVVVMGNWL